MRNKSVATVNQNYFSGQANLLQPSGQPLSNAALGGLLLCHQQDPRLADRQLNQVWDKGCKLVQLDNLGLNSALRKEVGGLQDIVNLSAIA